MNFVEPWRRENQRSDVWLCYLLRLTSNKRSMGRRRGPKSLGGLQSVVNDAAKVQDVTQLTPVERLAFEILKGKRIQSKSTQHPIERRAILLAEAVEAEWFPNIRLKGRPKGRWVRKSTNDDGCSSERKFTDGDGCSSDSLTPLLTITDVVLEAAPIIEGFAGCKITLHGKTFDALYHIVGAYSEVIERKTPRGLHISRQTVYQALRRARPELARQEVADSSEEPLSGK